MGDWGGGEEGGGLAVGQSEASWTTGKDNGKETEKDEKNAVFLETSPLQSRQKCGE